MTTFTAEMARARLAELSAMSRGWRARDIPQGSPVLTRSGFDFEALAEGLEILVAPLEAEPRAWLESAFLDALTDVPLLVSDIIAQGALFWLGTVAPDDVCIRARESWPLLQYTGLAHPYPCYAIAYGSRFSLPADLRAASAVSSPGGMLLCFRPPAWEGRMLTIEYSYLPRIADAVPGTAPFGWRAIGMTLSREQGFAHADGDIYGAINPRLRDMDGGSRRNVAARHQMMLMKWAVSVVLTTLAALGTRGLSVSLEPAPERLNRARVKQGKGALAAFWRVDLQGYATAVRESSRPSRELGGTHASPRPHLRRGHMRNLPTGKTTLVRDCIVGARGVDELANMFARTHYDLTPQRAGAGA